MRLRHVAALGLVGWYLIAPKAAYFERGTHDVNGKPMQGWLVDADDDFSNWSIVGTYDTAAGCQAERRDILEYGLTSRDKSINDPKGFAAAAVEASKRSQCVATDDPRLRGK